MNRIVLLLVSALVALPVVTTTAALPETNAVLAGAAYLKSIQGPDGTYGTSNPGQNMDSIYAIRAAGYDPAKDLVNGTGPVQYLTSKAGTVANSAEAAKAALAAKALGLDPKSVGGTDLIAKIAAGFDSATGKYAPGDAFSQSIAMVGVGCTGNTVPAAAVAELKKSQLENGGWGFGGFADPDTSAIAVQALLASGVAKADPAVVKALAYLTASQGNDGGWGYDVAASNASSTAFAVQALLALGENPESEAYTKNGATPVSYLLSQQLPDGSFAGFDPTYSTNQVLPALAAKTFCDAPAAPVVRVRPTPTPTAVPPTVQSPLPPATGNSPVQAGDGANAVLLAVFALVALAGGFGLAATARRRG